MVASAEGSAPKRHRYGDVKQLIRNLYIEDDNLIPDQAALLSLMQDVLTKGSYRGIESEGIDN